MKCRRKVLYVVVLLLGTITASVLLSTSHSSVNMLQPIHWDILPEIQIDGQDFGNEDLSNKRVIARVTTESWTRKGVTHKINTLTETQADQEHKGFEDEDFANKDAVTSKGSDKKGTTHKNSAKKDSNKNGRLQDSKVSNPSRNHRKSSPETFGYVISLRYGGQQSGGAGSLASLQCWIKSFDLPILIAEPALKRSKFYAADKAALRLGDIFDITKFNNLDVGRKEYGQIAPWDQFLKNAPREIVYVKIFDSKSEQDFSSWDTNVTLMDMDTADCNLPSEFAFLQSYKFCITKYVDFHVHDKNPFFTKNTYSPFPPKEVYKHLFQEAQPREVTLIIDHWLPMYCVPNYQLQTPEICRNVHYSGRRLIHASPHLLTHVEKYEQMFLQPRTTVAVMIRSEHLINWVAGQSGMKNGELDKTKLNQTVQGYLDEVIKVARNLKKWFPEGKTFVTLDAGKYGSGSWRSMFPRIGYSEGKSIMLEALKNTVVSLTENSLTFKEWEDSFTQVTGTITDGGYIAALQRTIGSRADCLVLVGGGTFGLGAISEYLHSHPKVSDHCYKFLAMAPGYRTLYKEAVKNLTSEKTAPDLT